MKYLELHDELHLCAPWEMVVVSKDSSDRTRAVWKVALWLLPHCIQ